MKSDHSPITATCLATMRKSCIVPNIRIPSQSVHHLTYEYCANSGMRRPHSYLPILLATAIIALSLPLNAQEMTYQQRRSYVLDVITSTTTTTTHGSKHGAHAAMAFFERSVVDSGIKIIDNIQSGADMFFVFSNQSCYMRYKHLYPQALKDKVKARQMQIRPVNAEGTGMGGTTENHRLMYAATALLAGEEWPDYPRDWYEAGKNYLNWVFTNTAQKGVYEYDSPSYWIHHVGPLLSVAEFSTDPLMRKKAGMIFEWYLATTAPEWLNGYHIASSSRSYDECQGTRFSTESNTACWVLFGGVRKPIRRPQVSWDWIWFIDAIEVVLTDYPIPDILVRIAKDRATPFVHKEHMAEYANGAKKYSYLDKLYGMCSQIDGNGFIGWSAQMTRWLVRWQTETYEQEPSTFLVKHPFDEGEAGQKFRGATKCEQVLQHEGTLVAAYAIDQRTYIEGMVTSEGYKKIDEEGNWLYMHCGSMLMAVGFAKPYVWSANRIVLGDFYNAKIIRSDGATNGLVVETSPVTPFAGGGIDAELERFKQAIKTRTNADFSGVNQTNPRVKYVNLGGDTLEIIFNTSRRVNEKLAVYADYNTWPLIENPWMEMPRGSTGLIMRHGGERREYDFANWTVSTGSDQPRPDLAIDNCTWSLAQPAPNQSITFTVAIRNSGSLMVPAASNAIVRMNTGSVQIGSTAVDLSGLAVGATRTVVIPGGSWRPVVGTTAILAEVDTENRVIETSEFNNTFSSRMTCGPDLVITQLRTLPTRPKPGDMVTFEAVIYNAGVSPSPQGIVHGIGLRINDVPITGAAVFSASIPAGDSAIIRADQPWHSVVEGSFTLRAFVDDVNRIEELDENNNIRYLQFGVGLVLNKLGGTPFGTDSWNTGKEFDKVFDGSIVTFFDGKTNGGGYCGLELSRPTRITKIRYYPRPDQFVSRLPGGKFQVSNESRVSGYTDLYTVPTGAQIQWYEIEVSDTARYKFVRFFHPTTFANIAEIEVYGFEQDSGQIPVGILSPKIASTQAARLQVKSDRLFLNVPGDKNYQFDLYRIDGRRAIHSIGKGPGNLGIGSVGRLGQGITVGILTIDNKRSVHIIPKVRR